MTPQFFSKPHADIDYKAYIQSVITAIVRDELAKAVAKAFKDARMYSEYMDTDAASIYLSISTYQLEQWRSRARKEDRGPRFVKLDRLVRYPRAELDSFMLSRLQDHTV